MPVHAIHHINLRADAALTARLRAFYIDVLGLQEGWRPPFRSAGHWLYLADQPAVHLVVDEHVGEASNPRRAVVDHVAFACTGLEAFEQRLAALQIDYRRSDVPGTALVQLFLLDPAGNGVELQFAGEEA